MFGCNLFFPYWLQAAIYGALLTPKWSSGLIRQDKAEREKMTTQLRKHLKLLQGDRGVYLKMVIIKS